MIAVGRDGRNGLHVRFILRLSSYCIILSSGCRWDDIYSVGVNLGVNKESLMLVQVSYLIQ